MAIKQGPPAISMQSLLLEEVITQAPSTRAMLKELQRRVTAAGVALDDHREVKRLTDQLADMSLELEKIMTEVRRRQSGLPAQARARGVVQMTAKASPKLAPATDWTPTPADVAAFLKSKEWLELTEPARVRKLESQLMQQVSGHAARQDQQHRSVV